MALYSTKNTRDRSTGFKMPVTGLYTNPAQRESKISGLQSDLIKLVKLCQENETKVEELLKQRNQLRETSAQLAEATRATDAEMKELSSELVSLSRSFAKKDHGHKQATKKSNRKEPRTASLNRNIELGRQVQLAEQKLFTMKGVEDVAQRGKDEVLGHSARMVEQLTLANADAAAYVKAQEERLAASDIGRIVMQTVKEVTTAAQETGEPVQPKLHVRLAEAMERDRDAFMGNELRLADGGEAGTVAVGRDLYKGEVMALADLYLDLAKVDALAPEQRLLCLQRLDHQYGKLRTLTALLREILGATKELLLEVDLKRACRMLEEATSDLMNAEQTRVLLIDSRSGELWCFQSMHGNLTESRVVADSGILRKVVAEQVMYLCKDPVADPNFVGKIDQIPGIQTHNLICAPVFDCDSDELVAVIQVVNKRSSPGGPHAPSFGPQDQFVLYKLASQASVILRNASQFQRERHHCDMYAGLVDTGRSLSVDMDGPPLISQLAAVTRRLLDVDKAFVYLADSRSGGGGLNESLKRASMGVNPAYLGKVLHCSAADAHPLQREVAIEGTILGDVYQRASSFKSDDVYEDPRWDPRVDELLSYRTRSMLAVPIARPVSDGGGVLGVLVAVNKRKGLQGGLFDADDEVVLSTLAAQAVVGMCNMSLQVRLLELPEVYEAMQQAMGDGNLLDVVRTVEAGIKEVLKCSEAKLLLLCNGRESRFLSALKRSASAGESGGQGPFAEALSTDSSSGGAEGGGKAGSKLGLVKGPVEWTRLSRSPVFERLLDGAWNAPRAVKPSPAPEGGSGQPAGDVVPAGVLAQAPPGDVSNAGKGATRTEASSAGNDGSSASGDAQSSTSQAAGKAAVGVPAVQGAGSEGLVSPPSTYERLVWNVVDVSGAPEEASLFQRFLGHVNSGGGGGGVDALENFLVLRVFNSTGGIMGLLLAFNKLEANFSRQDEFVAQAFFRQSTYYLCSALLELRRERLVHALRVALPEAVVRLHHRAMLKTHPPQQQQSSSAKPGGVSTPTRSSLSREAGIPEMEECLASWATEYVPSILPCTWCCVYWCRDGPTPGDPSLGEGKEGLMRSGNSDGEGSAHGQAEHGLRVVPHGGETPEASASVKYAKACAGSGKCMVGFMDGDSAPFMCIPVKSSLENLAVRAVMVLRRHAADAECFDTVDRDVSEALADNMGTVMDSWHLLFAK
eukprot:jgi/Mesvir1/9708/Mv12182-RA.1